MISKAFLLLSISFKIVNSDISCSTEPKCNCIILEDGIYADCMDKQLNSSPTFNENVTSINLSFNYLTYPPSNENLPECLQKLNVSNNFIDTLSFDLERMLFWKITGLQFLDLSSNKLLIDGTFFFPNIFSNFSLLELLDISGNVIPENGFPEFDTVMAPLISLRFLSVDIFDNITFGKSFEKILNLKSLKLAGVCNTSRTFIITEDFFFYLPFLEYLDVSTLEVWTNFYDSYNSLCYCSLTSIHRGAIGKLAHLKYLDISNNRYLGLCGLRNITNDLDLTSIEIFRANKLYCQDSRSVTLYCDDILNLRNTSLQELYIDGNNIAIGQPGILTYLPSSLLVLSIRENRWVAGLYTWSPYDNLINLVRIDISNINNHEMSQSDSAHYPCCLHFLEDVSCEKSRIKNVKGDNTSGSCSYTPQHYNDDIQSRKSIDIFKNPDPWRCFYPLGDADVHYIMVPENVKSIIMNNSRLGYAIRWTIFNTLSIINLTLSNNQFYSFIGPICNATNLKFLDLSGNKCSSLTPYFLNSLPSLETLLLNDNLLGLAGTLQNQKAFFVFGSLTNLLYLDLSSNKLSLLSKNIFWNLQKIKLISLKDNLLTDFDINIKHMPDLTFLDLSENQIIYLSNDAIDGISQRTSRNLKIDLSKNPFMCSCNSLKFLKWLQKNQHVFKGFSKYQCSNATNYETLIDAVISLDKICSSYIVLIIAILLLIIAFLVCFIIAIIYKNRWKIKYWYYIAKRNYFQHDYLRLEDRQNYKFDAFLSYADEERIFATGELTTKLEENENFRLCIHERDFIPGCDIADNIINAIHNSRKVIFIVTPFLKSKWCIYELNMAYMEYVVSRQGVNCMIMVIKEKIKERDIPRNMYDIMKDESYLTFPDDEEDEAAFWERLIDSLR
ncbi:toll-like receptor 4 [Mytilus californianus]|uniref:toll-like receptor 4 n=1 Tax=Mytilus californianus TaxID=6549 RepID=UPI00224826F2|nr:toll-like receptor 4 [Mytilus californianus]